MSSSSPHQSNNEQNLPSPSKPIRTDSEPNRDPAKPTREPVYRGVRRRSWGRYVSEIRIPKMNTRIWLGSFESAEMAARAHDSAAFFFKGKSATLNFPHLAGSLPQPHSSSRRDIQIAAAKAALQQPPPPQARDEEEEEQPDHGGCCGCRSSSSAVSGLSTEEGEEEEKKGWWFLDDELASFFDDDLLKPQLIAREYYRFDDGDGESCLEEFY